MNDKTIEILIQLLGHLRDHDFDVDSLSEVTESLIVGGYNESEVAEAVGWIFDRISTFSGESTEMHEHHLASTRVLSDFERLKISPDIWGYLLKLKSLSLITGTQMEKIIDYCMVIGSQKLTEHDMNEIVSAVIFDDQDSTPGEISF